MWVRSLLSQADAKTRSTGAPHSVGTQGSVSRLRPFRSRDRRNVGYDKVCVHLRKTRVSQSVTSRTHPRSPHSVSKDGFQFCQATLLNHRPRSLLAMPCKRADAPRSAGTSSYLVGDVASLSLV